MERNYDNAIAFGKLLRANSQAASIYDSYTDEQRTAVLLELQKLKGDRVKDFTAHLPRPHR